MGDESVKDDNTSCDQGTPSPVQQDEPPAEATHNPIFGGTGNKYQREVDYPGPAGLSLIRHYNSALPGWVHNFSHRVLADATNAVVVRPDGRGLRFKLDISGNWVASGSLSERLTRLTPANSSQPLWQYTTSADSNEFYDSLGRLLRIELRGGRSYVAQYDGAGYLASITTSLGRALTFQHDFAGRLVSATTPENTTITYDYDFKGRLAQVGYPDGSTRGYRYENSTFTFALTGLIDERGNRYSTWSYDAQGRGVSSEHAGGVGRHTLTYGTGTVAISDPLGTSRTQVYSRAGGRILFGGQNLPCSACKGDDAARAVNSTTGLIEQVNDFLGVTHLIGYDTARKLPTSRTRANGRPEAQTTSTQWHPTFRVPVLVTEPGRITAYAYDSLGNRTGMTVTDTVTGQARSWNWSYTPSGLVGTVTEPGGGVWQYGYDSLGNRATVTNPLGQATTFTHDAAGRVLTQTDPNGLLTANTYDLRGRHTSQVRGSETTSFSYIPTGQVGTVTQPSGYRIVYSYDAAQRLTGAQDNHGASVIYTLDAMGNRTREEVRDQTGAIAHATQRTINALNRVAAIQGDNGQATTFGYNLNGVPVGEANALAHTTTWTLDGLGRRITTTFADSTAASQAWNQLDQLTRVTDPRGLSTTYQPNAFGEDKLLSSPDTGTATMTYDANGNLATRTDSRGVLATYTYDALNRLQMVNYSKSGHADQWQVWNYDQTGAPYTNGVGRLTSAGNVDTATHYGYDLQGRLTTMYQIVNAAPGANTSTVVQPVGYGYDAGGNLASITYPSGRVLSISHTNGKPTALALAKDAISTPTNLLSQIQFTPLGALASWQWNYTSGPQGTTRTYDASGRLTRQQLGGYTREIGYDSADRIKTFTHVVTVTSAAAPDRNQSFQYDALGRLTSYSLGTTSWAIAYDANGNRTATALNGASTRTYSTEATSNRLMTVTSPLTTYTYDATGNVIALGAAQANYDLSGRWASMAAGGGTLTGTINVMGQRVRKYTNAGSGSVSLFVYDQRGQLLGEYDHTGAAIREYIWLGNTPVAMFTPDGPGNPPNIFFVETDHIATPRAVVDRNKAVRWAWLAEPFGTGAADENPTGLGAVTMPLRSPGQYFDQETGTHYNYFRDYDPWAGRYLQSDPIGLAGGLNTYLYVGGNPVSNIDPKGLFLLPLLRPLLPLLPPACLLSSGCRNLFGPMFQDKTPNTGEPGSWHTNPGNGQERYYGPNGQPEVDIDWHPDHGAGRPHGHNWDDDGRRGPGVPLSPWPKGRTPNSCPAE